MSVVSLKKIKLFGVRKDHDFFLEAIQKLGTIQIRTLDNDQYKKTRLESETTLLELEKILPIMEGYNTPSFSDKVKIHYLSESDFFSRQKSLFSDNSQLVHRIYSIYQEMMEGTQKIKELSEQLEILDAVKTLDISPQILKGNPYIHALVGRIADSSLRDIEKLRKVLPFDFDVLSSSLGFTYILCFYSKSFERNVLDELRLLEFQDWNGPFPKEGSFKTLFQLVCSEKHALVSKIEDIEIQLRLFSQDLHGLQMFYDYLSNRVTKDLLQYQTVESEFLFEMEGYIPSHSLKDLEFLLKDFPGCDYEITDLSEGEELPSLIENSSLTRPFEFVTDMYSRPGKTDLDPTPLFAPFFAIFMGIAIGDAGQGLLLSVFSYFVRNKLRVEGGMKKLLGVCFYGGLMSIVIGVLTGTYFAIPFEDFGIDIPFLYKPEKQVMLALVVSFVFGFIHITFAYIIRFFHLLSRKKIFDAIFDGLTHIIVMICGLMAVLAVSVPSLKGLLAISGYIFLIDVIAIWATAGRHYSDALVGRILWGVYGVYELTSIFGDLLSYARLFALGLAGGIIGSAINQLTPGLLSGIHFSSVGSSIYAIVMIILFFVILIVGHLFTMIIGILGAFIHTMRLQFVEFFGKFFQGGGIAFQPFQIKSKYYWIKKYKEKTIEK